MGHVMCFKISSLLRQLEPVLFKYIDQNGLAGVSIIWAFMNNYSTRNQKIYRVD